MTSSEPLPAMSIPPVVEDARRVLTAVLAAGPVLAQALTVSEALTVLHDVHPAYPPLGLEDDPTEPDVGIPAAMRLLEVAIAETTSIPALCRYGEAIVLLRRALAEDAEPPRPRP